MFWKKYIYAFSTVAMLEACAPRASHLPACEDLRPTGDTLQDGQEWVVVLDGNPPSEFFWPKDKIDAVTRAQYPDMS